MGTVTQLADRTAQAAPQPTPQDSSVAYFNAGYELGLAVGADRERRELGLPSLLASHTAASCATILSLARP